jgi:CMP-N-acetylneuraminic acid synthetase
MMKKNKILGVTPARAGSKAIPGKNIKMIAGKPLIAWTIEQALASKKLDAYIVSTESDQIARIAKKYGAEVVSRRKELAQDSTTTLEVLQDLLKTDRSEIIVLLQATSPVRGEGLIDACIERFLRSGADSLASGWNCKFEAYGTRSVNRQDKKGFFYDDGNIYVFTRKNILKGDPFGKKHELVYLDKEQNMDIDDAFDFWVAEQVLLKQARHTVTR